MTIDERLDRLTERHEALAQTLELLSLDVAQVLAASKQDAENIKLLLATVKQDGENIQALIATVKIDGENIRGLARIAEIHDRRLNALEGNADQ